MYWNRNSRPVRRIPVRVAAHEGIPLPVGEQQLEGEVGKPPLPDSDEVASPANSELDWEALALRLQADMDNFRKRQVRRADEAIGSERERLLRLMLPVVDNLARALNHGGQRDESLQQGVELTYRELMRLLEAEGLTRINAVGQSFNPELHEAVATTATDAEQGTVVEEVEAGYTLGDRLLRPARVIVAS
jgi:molecular chaperone GrpE